MVGKCVKFCCCPKTTDDEGLKLPKCAFSPGVYQNVNIEIGQNCQIISITPADKEQVNLCDPCDNTENEHQ